MTAASVKSALAREFERELGILLEEAERRASDVSEVVRLRLMNPPCPVCVTPFPRPVAAGEKVQCQNCKNWFTVEDATERAVSETLRDVEGLSPQFVKKIQAIFSGRVEAVEEESVKEKPAKEKHVRKKPEAEGKKSRKTKSVQDIRVRIKAVLDKLNIPVQLPSAWLIGDASAKAEALDAVELLEKALAQQGEEAVQGVDLDTLLQVGNIFFANGASEKALQYYNKAVKINPNYAAALLNMGNVYRGMRDLRKAVEIYETAVRIDPDSLTAETWYDMGTTYYELGDRRKAIDMFLKAVAKKPDYADAYNWIGKAYYDEGVYGRALENYNRAVEINPDHAQAWTNMGDLYNRFHNHQKAKEMWDKAERIRESQLIS